MSKRLLELEFDDLPLPNLRFEAQRTMSTADGYVLPKPGVPKTLGILSTIFAVLMILYGLCMTGYMAAMPMILELSTSAQKKVAETAEANQKAQLKALDDQEKAATSDEQKEAYKRQRATIEAQPKVAMLDMTELTKDAMSPPVLMFTYTTLITGIILAIILLVAGIGLIRLTPWGRTLGLWWAGLQITQILALLIVSMIVIMPIQQEANKKMFAKIEADAKVKGNANNPALSGMAMAQAMSKFTAVLAVMNAIVGCAYPTVMLILLSTAGARAACLPKRSPDLEGF